MNQLDGGGYVSRRHVVEKDGLGSAFERLLEFLAIADFHLHPLTGLARGERCGQYLGNATAKRDVVVLDEDAVGEIETMVLAASAGDSVFIQQAQSGHSLAGVKNFRLSALHLVYIAAGNRSDAAHSLHQIEDYSFAGGGDLSGGTDDGNRLSALDPHSVEDLRMMYNLIANRIRTAGCLA